MRVPVPGGAIAAVVRARAVGATPVVFLHGLNSAASVWGPVIGSIAPGRACAALDLRGHGGSTRQGPYAAARHVDDLLAVLDALGWPRVHLVGSSFGGGIALAAAAAHPHRVASVAVLGTSLRAAPEVRDTALAALTELGVEGFFAAVGPVWTFGPDPDPAHVEQANRIAVANRREVVAELLRAGFGEDFQLAAVRVRCPVLVARGEHDRTCPAQVAAATAADLGTVVRTIPGAGHLPMIEAPAATADLIRSFHGAAAVQVRA